MIKYLTYAIKPYQGALMSLYLIAGESRTIVREDEWPDGTTTLDLKHSSVISIITSKPWPEIIVLNVPAKCMVNLEHFPKLMMFNGQLNKA
jgi:hypothetical protein